MEDRTLCWAAPHARKPLPPSPPPPHFTAHLGWCDALSSQGWGRTLLTCQVPTAPQKLLFLLPSPFSGQLCRLPAVLWGGQQPQRQAARAGRATEPLPAPLCPPQTHLCTQLLAPGTEKLSWSWRRLREEFKPLGTSHDSSLRALAGGTDRAVLIV